MRKMELEARKDADKEMAEQDNATPVEGHIASTPR